MKFILTQSLVINLHLNIHQDLQWQENSVVTFSKNACFMLRLSKPVTFLINDDKYFKIKLNIFERQNVPFMKHTFCIIGWKSTMHY